MTRGYRLPAKWVIHTVGPVWNGGTHGEDGLLASCYRNSLALAAKHGIRSIAFPAISTGVYRFPKERAARIAWREVRAHGDNIELIRFVCFGAEDAEIYRHSNL
jgi:O-acetyl-ADP-ribose deacetylase (regulator of RNase III)